MCFRCYRNHKDDLVEYSGTNYPVFGAKILWWKNEFPQIHNKVSKYLFLCGYIAGKLANIKAEDAFVDKSHLQWTALADLKKGNWSHKLCDSFGINKGLLPKLSNPTMSLADWTKRWQPFAD
jgi:xylulokinase